MALHIKQEVPFYQDVPGELSQCLVHHSQPPPPPPLIHSSQFTTGAQRLYNMHHQLPPQPLIRHASEHLGHGVSHNYTGAQPVNTIGPVVQRKNSAEEKQLDSQSAKGVFGWTSIDGVSVPCLFRDSKEFVAVRMVELKLLSKYPSTYPEELKTKPPLMSHYVTPLEAKLLNEINTEHCAGEYGEQQFTRQDLIVRLNDFEEFYKVVKKHFPNIIQNGQVVQVPNPNTSPVVVDGGWLQINNTVVPFVIRGEERMVPLSVVRYAAGLLTDVVVEGSHPTESECFYLNAICKAVGLNFHFAKTARLITLVTIASTSTTPVEIGELPKGDPFNHAEYKGLTPMAKEAVRIQQQPNVVDNSKAQSTVNKSSLPEGSIPVSKPGTVTDPVTNVQQPWLHPNINMGMYQTRPPPPYPGANGNRKKTPRQQVPSTVADIQNIIASIKAQSQSAAPATQQVPNSQPVGSSKSSKTSRSRGSKTPKAQSPAASPSAVLALQQLHQIATEKGYITDAMPSTKSPAGTVPQMPSMVPVNAVASMAQLAQSYTQSMPETTSTSSSRGSRRSQESPAAPTSSNGLTTPMQLPTASTAGSVNLPMPPLIVHPQAGQMPTMIPNIHHFLPGSQTAQTPIPLNIPGMPQGRGTLVPVPGLPHLQAVVGQFNTAFNQNFQAGQTAPTTAAAGHGPSKTNGVQSSSVMSHSSSAEINMPTPIAEIQTSIQPVEFNGKTISCLKRKNTDGLYALVEAIARVYFPSCSLEDFQVALEGVLKVPICQLTHEEEKAFIQFYGLPTQVLICNKVVKLVDIEHLMPSLKYMLTEKDKGQVSNGANPLLHTEPKNDRRAASEASKQPASKATDAIKESVNNKRSAGSNPDEPQAKTSRTPDKDKSSVNTTAAIAADGSIDTAANVPQSENKQGATVSSSAAEGDGDSNSSLVDQQTLLRAIDVAHKLKVTTTDEGSVVICLEEESAC